METCGRLAIAGTLPSPHFTSPAPYHTLAAFSQYRQVPKSPKGIWKADTDAKNGRIFLHNSQHHDHCSSYISNHTFPEADIVPELTLGLNYNRLPKPSFLDRNIPSLPPLLQWKAACNLRAALFAQLQHAMLDELDEIRDVAPLVHPLAVKLQFPLPAAYDVSRATLKGKRQSPSQSYLHDPDMRQGDILTIAAHQADASAVTQRKDT